MEDLVKEFIDETMESITEMDVDLVKLEQNPNNQELLSRVFRLMHTIKGTCGFIGLVRLEKTAHSAENLLDNFRSGTMSVNEENITLLFMAIDRVRFLVTELHKSGTEPTGSDEDIIQAIEAYMRNYTSGSSPTQEESVAESIPQVQESISEPVKEQVKKEVSQEPTLENAPQEKQTEYLRVQMSVLENMINMVSELVLTRNQLLQLSRHEESSAMKTPLHRLNRIVSDLQDNVMKTRMQPIGNAWVKLPRIVRDLSTELKKKINLEMIGEETELDRQVLELIKDPLTHMIRNSCDHGIETPEDRVTKGKREQGTIRLEAYHEGGYIVIRISDDGKGLNKDFIAKKAVEKGLIDANKAKDLTEKQVFNLIMKPGFSTAEKITNVSGRGVGMDVVLTNIQKIGGSIDVDSKVDGGTSFVIHIPLTLAIISALIVEIDNHRYAIPQMSIQELLSLRYSNKDVVEYINNKPVLRLRDKIIPLLDSNSLFRKQGSEIDIDAAKEKSIVILNSGSSCYGVIVDKIFDTEEVVIKSVSSVLKDVGIFSGNTILGDGQVIMIIDPAAIVRIFNVEKEGSNAETSIMNRIEHTKQIASETASMLVFRAGEGLPKAMPLALISRLHVFRSQDVKKSGDKMLVEYNGDLLELLLIEKSSQNLGAGDVMTLILSDDRSESRLGLIIDTVIDIVEDKLHLNASTARPGFLGSMLLKDQTVDIIDIAYYMGANNGDWFSAKSDLNAPFIDQHLDNIKSRDPEEEKKITPVYSKSHPRRPANTEGKPRVLVVDDSSFFRMMLSPILKSAGYDVTLAEDPLEAIKMHDRGDMFDIILSDIEMPNMDGYEFVEKMLDQSAWKETPFIAITSHNTPQDIEYGYKKGFRDYLGKFNKDEIIKSMRQVRA